MKVFSQLEKVGAEDFAYGSDMRALLSGLSAVLEAEGCTDTSEFITIQRLDVRQVIYISIGGWEYEYIFDSNGYCQELRFQYEDGNYYTAEFNGNNQGFAGVIEKMKAIIRTVVVLDNLNQDLQRELLRHENSGQ